MGKPRNIINIKEAARKRQSEAATITININSPINIHNHNGLPLYQIRHPPPTFQQYPTYNHYPTYTQSPTNIPTTNNPTFQQQKVHTQYPTNDQTPLENNQIPQFRDYSKYNPTYSIPSLSTTKGSIFKPPLQPSPPKYGDYVRGEAEVTVAINTSNTPVTKNAIKPLRHKSINETKSSTKPTKPFKETNPSIKPFKINKTTKPKPTLTKSPVVCAEIKPVTSPVEAIKCMRTVLYSEKTEQLERKKEERKRQKKMKKENIQSSQKLDNGFIRIDDGYNMDINSSCEDII